MIQITFSKYVLRRKTRFCMIENRLEAVGGQEHKYRLTGERNGYRHEKREKISQITTGSFICRSDGASGYVSGLWKENRRR